MTLLRNIDPLKFYFTIIVYCNSSLSIENKVIYSSHFIIMNKSTENSVFRFNVFNRSSRSTETNIYSTFLKFWMRYNLLQGLFMANANLRQ